MYKIILNDKIVDVVKHPKFIKFLSNGCIAITDKSSANGIVGSDDTTLYSFCYLVDRHEPIVSIAEINENEFSRLECLLNSENPVYADEAALMKAKRAKLNALSEICKNKITAGFTLDFPTGKQSFKLTVEDQLNLMQIESQLAAGEVCFVYHATDKPCRVYSRKEMLKITKAFRKHVLYHTTYYNAVKQYINSLSDINFCKFLTKFYLFNL
jgi:hypothetical protein